jgi:hypothetical protein
MTSAAAEAIDDHDISVVIQGPLWPHQEEGIVRCLESIRRHLPNAEIIVSTWRGEDCSAARGIATIIESPDPGCFRETPERPYNLNRLQQSTMAGLQRASRRCTLKFRADLALVDRRFLRLAHPRAHSLLQRPITLSNLYIRNPERFPLLFHVSDTVQFGLTADLLSYWEGPPWTADEVLLPEAGSRGLLSRIRLFPEQAATLRWLGKHGITPAMPHASALDRSMLKTWGQVLSRNFHVVGWQNTGICFPERFVSDPSVISTLLDEETAGRLDHHEFSYRKASVNRFLGLTYLVHGKLGPALSLLQTRFPNLYRKLRSLWIAYQKHRAC